MASKQLVLAACLIVSATPLLATAVQQAPATAAPPGNVQTRYCMHVDPVTGSLVQTTQCWTREEWAEQGVDVDAEWAKNGVKVIG